MLRTTSTLDDRNYLQKLRTFCAAVQAGSFSRAARALGLSQPTVSLQIQGLEARLNVPLFHRHGPKVVVSPEGRTFYDLVHPLVASLDSLEERFHTGNPALESGWVRIAAGESTILYLLPPFLQEYAARYPGVEIRLHNVTGAEGLKLLRGGAVDLVVGPLVEVPDDIVYRPAFTYAPMLIVARDHPLAGRKRVSIREVARHPLILPPPHLSTWRVVDYVFQKYNLTYRVAVEAGGWEVIKKYVECGLGVSIVTSICLTGQERLAAIDMSRYFPRRTYGLVLPRHRRLTPPAARLAELIQAKSGKTGRKS